MPVDNQVQQCVDCGHSAGYVCSEFSFMESLHLLIDAMGIEDKDGGIRLLHLALDLEAAVQHTRKTAHAASIQWTLRGAARDQE